MKLSKGQSRLLSLVISKDLSDLGLSSNDSNKLVASLLLVDCTYGSQ